MLTLNEEDKQALLDNRKDTMEPIRRKDEIIKKLTEIAKQVNKYYKTNLE